MLRRTRSESRRSILACLICLAVVTVLAILPYQFRTKAGGNGLFTRTVSQEPELPNYDIRIAKGEEINDFLVTARTSVGKNAAAVADLRDGFVTGEAALRQTMPTLKVEYNEDIRTPEIIAPDINQGFKTMTGPASKGVKNAETLRSFIQQNRSLIGVTGNQASQLKVTADYINPAGNIAYAHLEQFINDIPVFRAEIKAGFTSEGEMFRVINNLAPDLDYDSLSSEFGDPTDAVKAAFTKVSRPIKAEDTARNASQSTDLKTVFGSGDWATTAEKMYFPTEPGVAIPAWRVMIWQPVNAYYVIVDAKTGTMLWRKNLGNDQVQTATYQVYQAPTSYIGIAGNAAPMSPGPIDPGLGSQGVIGTRTNLTVIGNEAPNPGQNNLGWITDGTNITDGNNVQAGIDRDGTNGVDAPQTGAPNRVFDSTWNPPPGAPAPGDDPLTTQAQRGAVIQMFVVMNRYHDELYSLGFTEAARNFQNDNFGRGGVAADRVSAEGQDSSGTNNANFNAGADGTRGRMQMYLWPSPTPDRDGTGDAEIIIHEVTHGTSQRLHNNNAGLTANMSGGMGEGWGDFFGHTMLARPSESLDSVNATGGYALFGFPNVLAQNYYYGIRRFPKARMSFTGGPQNRPHNPMTFADIDSNQINVTNGAYPAMSGSHISTQADQVHAAGEIWSTALWEVRCLMVGRLGFTAGSRKVLQAVTDGMKLDPINPTFLQSRDSIVTAAAALRSPEAGADVVDVREGFRIRGMGFSASIQSGNGTPARVTEAFDTPNAIVTNPITFTDPAPGGNANGFADPGETIIFSVPVTNATGAAVTNVTVSANGGPPVSYGTVANGATVTQSIPFTISPGQPCGSTLSVSFALNSDSGIQVPTAKDVLIGQPIIGFTENFDGVTAPNQPAGWTTAVTGSGVAATTSTTTPSSAPNDEFLPEGTTTGTTELVTPAIAITSASAQLSFKNLFNTENTFDGMVLEISNPSVNGGAYQDIITAGGSFASGGYRTGIVQSGTCTDPLNGRQAWTGLSGGTTAAPTYIDSVVNLPASANGQSIKLKFLVGFDCSLAGTTTPGVRVDSVTITTGTLCPPPVVRSRADFDGDGKTDFSVFRPSTGTWYLNKSTAGFAAFNWGTNGDAIVPGDWDGDGKADTAVFRPTNTAGAGDFYILNSNGFTATALEWGVVGDVAVSGDYDGDGKTDAAVFRPSNGTWFIRGSLGGVRTDAFGQAGDVPMAIDKEGDGKANISVYRSSDNRWYIAKPTGVPAQNFDTFTFGFSTDIRVPADYDGDGKDDAAVFRPSTGQWFVLRSSDGVVATTSFGTNGDVPVPGDYDGDGKDDLAVYRGGTWYVLRSTAGSTVVPFGLASDIPVPKGYIP